MDPWNGDSPRHMAAVFGEEAGCHLQWDKRSGLQNVSCHTRLYEQSVHQTAQMDTCKGGLEKVIL